MSYYIGVEKLAANALIELMINRTSRTVSFRALREYGTEVVRLLNDRGEKAILLFSRDSARSLVYSCSDFFTVENPDSIDGTITLKDEVTADDLAKRFCGSMIPSVLQAMLNEQALQVLFEAAA